MRLELANFPVKDVRFDGRTNYNGGVLEINREELAALALEDGRVVSAKFDVAFPGEQTRIVRVRDVVEPRLKLSGAPASLDPWKLSVKAVPTGFPALRS